MCHRPQGIVPAKAAKMSYDMVTMVTDKLINVQARACAAAGLRVRRRRAG